MDTILKKIVNRIRADEEENFRLFSLKSLKTDRKIPPVDIIPLIKKNFFLIAEIKRGSPSKGIIRENFDLLDIARAYEKGGASAISVITEKNFFFGKKEFLLSVKQITDLPVLRKDFLFHPYQIYESYNLGADFILLIVGCLSNSKLKHLYRIAITLGMKVLVEVHDEDELKRALDIKPKIIGINNRDLKTFKVDLQTSFRLKKLIPEDILVISESGIKTHKDIIRLKNSNFSGVLIGESLLIEENVKSALDRILHG